MRRPFVSLGLLLAAIGTITWLANLNQPPPLSASGCPKIGGQRAVTIDDSGIRPADLKTSRCDELLITNRGQAAHQFALGTHPDHLRYPGFEELIMQPGQQNRLVLSVTGSYDMHDHLHEQLKGRLTISAP